MSDEKIVPFKLIEKEPEEDIEVELPTNEEVKEVLGTLSAFALVAMNEDGRVVCQTANLSVLEIAGLAAILEKFAFDGGLE
jgi:hypothetical protein